MRSRTGTVADVVGRTAMRTGTTRLGLPWLPLAVLLCCPVTHADLFYSFESPSELAGGNWNLFGNGGTWLVETREGNAVTGDSSLAVGAVGSGNIFTYAQLTLPDPLYEGTVSVWRYDQFGGNSPYYQHFWAFSRPADIDIATISTLDSGYGGTSWVYRVGASAGGIPVYSWGTRTVGWHEYSIDMAAGFMTLQIDGDTVTTASTGGLPLSELTLFYHNLQGAGAGLWDDLSITYNQVPEPGSALLLVSAAATVLSGRRARRKPQKRP